MNKRLREIAFLFLKLGTIGFGGPAAHIAMMEDEVVKRRQWLTPDEFLDLLGITNLIPGPNSTEMAIHIGLRRGGWKGFLVAGVCFILPAASISLLLAHLYLQYGTLPHVGSIMRGIHSGILAVIVASVFRLGKPMVHKRIMVVLAALTFGLNLAGGDEVLLLFCAGAVGLVWGFLREPRQKMGPAFIPVPLLGLSTLIPVLVTGLVPGEASLTGLGVFFLKVGMVLYGSGYVLFAFLESGLVEASRWITQSQLIDAIVAGQVTPGPVLSSATFLGYIILGVPGAAVATTGIFLPSFILVVAVSPFIQKLRSSPLTGHFLDGVTAASLGLMLAVGVILASATLIAPVSWGIFALAGIAVLTGRINLLWIVAGSGLIGWIWGFI